MLTLSDKMDEVFGDEYLGTALSVRPEEAILGCGRETILPQVDNKSDYGTAIYYDGTIWKAAMWDNMQYPILVKAASLQTLKTKLELLQHE